MVPRAEQQVTDHSTRIQWAAASAVSLACLGLAWAGAPPASAAGAAPPVPGAAILQQLRSFSTTGTLLPFANLVSLGK